LGNIIILKIGLKNKLLGS